MRISRLLGAEGRAQARRAVEARVLPRAVGRFYRRAIASAVSARDVTALAAIPEPRELLALLEAAAGCNQVIELGRDDPVTPVALAIDDARRHVTSFRPATRPGDQRYAALVDPSTRARVDFRPRPLERAPVVVEPPASLALIDGWSDHRQVEAAFESCRGALRPGGLVVFRRHGDPAFGGVGAAVAELALEGRSAPEHLYLWRKPLEEVAAVTPARRRRLPWAAMALAIVGIALGIGGAALATQLGDDGDKTTAAAPATTAPPAPATQTTQAPPPESPGQESSPLPEQSTSPRTGTTPAPEPGEGSSGTTDGERPGGVFRFTGTGPRTLGRVRVRKSSFLGWTTQGGTLEIKSRSFELNASAQRGRTVIPRGTYRRLRVRATTPWTLEILPR